jgi:hypothetical protein
MDVKRISAADWLMIGGAVSTFVFGLFLDWARVDHVSGNNAFDYFLTGGIAWILAVGVGIVAFLLASGQMRPDGRPWPLIETVAATLAVVLMLVRLLLGAGSATASTGVTTITLDLDRAVGMWLTALSVAVVAAGAALGWRAPRVAAEPKTFQQ